VSGPRAIAPPLVAIVDYTLRACLPAKRWVGVLLPCAGALFFGWLATVLDDSYEAQNFADVAEQGLFGMILPLTCLVIGDAVVAADVRAGTFQLTWLSPVKFPTIIAGRWLGGWLVAVVTLVPAFSLSALIADQRDAAGPLVVAVVAGSAAYIALFVLIGVLVRRSALWALALVFIGERMLGGALSGVGQLSPLWQAQQTFAGLWGEGTLIERSGMPDGWFAVIRLVAIAAVALTVASWRVAHIRPVSDDE
jgi:hypothetical protein